MGERDVDIVWEISIDCRWNWGDALVLIITPN